MQDRAQNPFAGNAERKARNPFAGNEERKKPRGYKTPEEIARLNAADRADVGLGPLETLRGGVRAALSGLTLGGADELEGYLRRFGPTVVNGRIAPRPRDDSELAKVRAEREAFAQEYPAADLALNVLGGGLLRAPFKGKGFKTAVKNVGLLGGVAGAGYADGDLKDRAIGAAVGAGTGLGVAGLLHAPAVAGAVARKAKDAVSAATRVIRAKPLGKTAFELNDAMRAADDALYGAVAQEAGGAGTSPAIQAVLTSKTVKPFADAVRSSETFAAANDATVLTEAYKLMSGAARKTGKQIEGTAEFLAEAELKRSDIGKAKGRMMAAATPTLPTFPQAVETHRVAAQNYDVFTKTADAIRRVLEGTSIKGKKLLLDSPEALARNIERMTPSQAEQALSAVLGRAREVVRLTSNPVGKFGIVSSTAHAIRAPFQIAPYVELLERQMGKRKPLPSRGLLMTKEATRRAAQGITSGLLQQR